MTSSRHLFFAVIVGLAILLVGGAVIVWPNYKNAREMNERIEELHAKSRDLQVQDAILTELGANLEAVTDIIDEELKVTPPSANIADLMGRLSIRPDGVTVLDQSFTTGQPSDAVPGSGLTVQATPLTIEITGRFDAIFALIRSVETMNRLVRVASISLNGKNAEQDVALAPDGTPLITATVGLEALFDTGSEEVR